MRNIYWHNCLICACKVTGICVICMAFEGHLCFWYMYVYVKVAVWFFLFLTCNCSYVSEHVDYVIRSHDKKVILHFILII